MIVRIVGYPRTTKFPSTEAEQNGKRTCRHFSNHVYVDEFAGQVPFFGLRNSFFLECTYNYLFALSRVGFLEKCSFRQSHSNDDTKKTKRTNEPEKEKRKKSKTAFTAW